MTQKQFPKYRKQKRRGVSDRAFVELGGRRVYLGCYGSPESKQAYHRVLAEWDSGGKRLPAPLAEFTILELIAAFWQHAEQYYRRPDGTPTSELDNFRQALRPLRELYGSSAASQFGPKSLRAVREKMMQLGWCRSNINKQINRIKHVFKWAVGQELIAADAYQALSCVAGLKRGRCEVRETEPRGPVPEAHILAVRPYVSRQVWALIQLQLYTGARAGELVGMRAVDLNTGEKVWTYSPQWHKTSHHGLGRTIYFGPQAQELIQPFLANRPLDGCVFSPTEAERERYGKALTHRRPNQKPNTRITDREVGDHYTPASYRRAIARACKAAGVPVWSPHRLRHTAATLIRRQFGLEAAQIMLGHAKADVTQLYAEANHQKAIEVAAKIG